MKNDHYLHLRPPTLYLLFLINVILSVIVACSTSSKQPNEQIEPDPTHLLKISSQENVPAQAETQTKILEKDQIHTEEKKEKGSSVTVDYELNKDHYLFQVVSLKDKITVKSYLDKQLLRENLIARDKYLVFVNKAARFIEIPRNYSYKHRPCRGPFKVTVISGESKKFVKGCRNDNGPGSISRLIREGEFLLYSTN